MKTATLLRTLALCFVGTWLVECQAPAAPPFKENANTGISAGPPALRPDEEVELRGVIIRQEPTTNQGEPTSVPAPHDWPRPFILVLTRPIKVTGIETEIGKVQLGSRTKAIGDAAIQELKRWEEFAQKGQKVMVKGKLWLAENVYHRTPVLLDVAMLDSLPALQGRPKPQIDLSTIVPGKAVGKVRLGMTLPEVEGIWGGPSNEDAALGVKVLWWNAPKATEPIAGILFTRNEAGDAHFAEQISIFSPDAVTSTGIKVGSPLDGRELAPDAKTAILSWPDGAKVMDAQREGIAVQMSDAGNPVCRAIIIHKKGVAASPETRRQSPSPNDK